MLHSPASCIASILWTYGILSVSSYRVVNVESELCSSFGADGCIVNQTIALNCTATSTNSSTVLPWSFPQDPAPDDICTIEFTSNVTFTNTSGLTCINSTICQLWINVSSVVNGTTVGPSMFTVMPSGAYIAANTIRIAADVVSIGAGSSITASGLGLAYGPAPGSQGSGGNYGGTGGGMPCQVSRHDVDQDALMMKTRLGVSTPAAMRVDTCCSKRYFNSYSNVSVGSFSAPDVGWDTADPGSWGSGSGDFGQVRAGGRIWITATQSIGIDGTISADGDVGNGSQTFGSGSGGVVVLDSANIGNNGGKVSANGGAGSIGHGAGGGGRIVLRYDTLSLPVSSVSAYGGTVQNSVSLDPTCFAGAAGTVFYSQRIPDQLDPAGLPLRYNTLRVSNDNLEALAVTPVYLDYNTLAGQFGPGTNATNTTNGTAPQPLVPLPPGVYAQDVTVGVDAFVVTGSSYVASLRLSTRKLFSTLNMPPPVLASPIVKDPHMALATWRAEEGNWSSEAVPYAGDLTPAELIALGDDAMPLWQRMRKQLQQTRAVIVQYAAEACGQDTGSDSRTVPPCLLSALSSGWSALPAQPVVGVSISLGFLLPLVDAANPPPPLGVNDTRANLTIITSELQVRASTILASGTSVWVNAGNVTLVADAMLQVQDRVYLVTNSTAYIDCKLAELTGGFPAVYDGSDALLPGAVVVRAGKSVYYGPDTGLMTSQLYSYSDGNITVNGVIGTTNFELHEERVCRFDISRRELCRDIDWRLNQASPPNSSYLLVLSARGGVVEITSNGRVNVEVGLLCGQQVNIDGPVSAEGQGCTESLGFGSGKASASGSGGGAGHASAGGAAADGALGGPYYDDATLPLFVGSGGGGSLGADGDGGGFIMAEGTFQVYVAPGTDLTAAASDGYSEGGGSGGTLIVRTFQLMGSGRLSVEGGGSYGEGGGGGGSGGILKLQSATLGPTLTAASSGSASVPYGASAIPRVSPVKGLWARFEDIARRFTSALALFVSDEAQSSASAVARAQRLMESCHALASDVSNLHQDARAQYTAAITAAHQEAEQSNAKDMEAALLWREEALSFLEAMAALQTLLVHVQHASAACAQHAACARLHALTLSSTTAAPAQSVHDGASESMDLHVYLRSLGVLTPVVLRDIASLFSGTLVLNGGPGAQGGQPGGNGTLNSPLCPAGTQRNERAQCLPCGLGRWRNGSVDAPFMCALCANAPAKGTYTDETEDEEQCDYICPAGTLYPACLTSFEAVIDDFGGPLNFGLSVGGVITSVAAALLCVCQQRARAARAFKQSEGILVGKEDGLTFNMLLGWSSSGGSLERKGSKLGKGLGSGGGYGSAAGTKNAGGRYGVFLGGTAAMGQADGEDRYDMAVAILQGGTGTLKTESSGWLIQKAKLLALAYRASGTTTVDFLMSACAMQESDLPRHATRIYLGGSNTFASSWRLPWDATRRMRRHVRSGPYAELADKVNEILQWNRWGWEEWSYLFVRLLAPPLGEMFLRWRRRIRVVLLLQMLLASDRKDGWLRGAKAAMLADCVRVGVSGDLSQAHVDILASDRHSLAKTSAPLATAPAAGPSAPQPGSHPQGVSGGVTLPLTLLLSGDGSFGRPLHIDGNDLLVRCVPGLPGVLRFIDSDWTEFVAEFNARARLLTAGALLQTAGPLLDFLAAVRADPDLLGGLQVDLVRCWPTAQSAVEGQAGVSSQRRPAGGGEGVGKPGASGAIRPQESGDSFARERSEGTDGSSGLEPGDSRDRTPDEGVEAEGGRLGEDSKPQDAAAAATSVGYITLTRQSSIDSALPALLSGRRISDAEYQQPRSPHVVNNAGSTAGAHSPHPKGLPGKPGSGSRLHAFIEEDSGSPQWIHRHHGREVSGDDMRLLGKGGPGPMGLDLDDVGPTSPALLYEGRARGMSASRSLFVRSIDIAVPEAGGAPSSRRSSGSEASVDRRGRAHEEEEEAIHIPVGPALSSREPSVRMPARSVSAAPVSKEGPAWQTSLGATALDEEEDEDEEADLGFGYHGKRTQLWWSGLTSLVEDVVSSHECRLGILITLRSSNGTPSMGAGREGSAASGGAALALSSPALQGRTASAEVYPVASRAASALALSSQTSGTGSRPGGFGPVAGPSKPNRSPYQRAIGGPGSTSPGFTAAQRAQYRLEAEMEDVDNAGVTLSGTTGQGAYSSAFSGGVYPHGLGLGMAGPGPGQGYGFGAHEHGMFQFGVGDEGVAMVQNATTSASAATGNGGSTVAGRPALSSAARGMSMRRILVSEAKQQQQQMYQGTLESSYGGYQATASAAAAPLSLGTSVPVGRRGVRGGTDVSGPAQGPLITSPFTAWAAVGNYDYWIGDADAVLWTASEPANAALTVLANALLLPQPYVGGDADVRGKRLPLVTSRLPVPGLPFAADIQLDGGLQLDFSRTGSLRTSHLFYMIGGSTWTPETGVKARRKPSNGSKRKGPTAAGADGSDEEIDSFGSRRAGVDVRFSPSRSAGDLRSLQRSRSGRGRNKLINENPMLAESDFMQRVLLAEMSRRKVALKQLLEERGVSHPRRSSSKTKGRQSSASPSRGTGKNGSQSSLGKQTHGYSDEDDGSSSLDSSDEGNWARAKGRGGRKSRAGSTDSDSSDGSNGRGRGSNRYDDDDDDNLDDDEPQLPLPHPAPPESFWSAGLAGLSLCGYTHEGHRAILTRTHFVLRRLLCRRAAPLSIRSAWKANASFVLHGVCLLLESILTVILIAQLACIESSGVVEPYDNAAAPVDSLLVVGDCSYFVLALYLAAPPLACLLAPLAGLFAIAAQSVTTLRAYAKWNAASLLSTLCALIMVALNVDSLGTTTLTIPLVLLALKMISTSVLLPLEVTALESHRPVRGWRGLYEIRAGPYERSHRAQAELLAGKRGGGGWAAVDGDTWLGSLWREGRHAMD